MTSAVNPETRAQSSILIGNVPYDITEEQLRDLFSEVGAVINFRLLCDKGTGKSSGFAFCEYKEPEIAISATRNLGGYELKGQPLRVDIATSEKCRQDLERLQGSIKEAAAETSESVPEKAPEEISKAVASLPAEQMFELMKQMKMCIENNPQEARNLLLQNPQLAYALLQAQVIMRIVDPAVAVKILDRPTGVPVHSGNMDPETKSNVEQISVAPPPNEAPQAPGMSAASSESNAASVAQIPQPVTMNPHGRPSMNRPSMMTGPVGSAIPNQFADQDLRTLGDQDLRQLPPIADRDMRPPPVMMVDKDMRIPMGDQDFRTINIPPAAMPETRPFDPRFRNAPGPDVTHAPVPNFDRGRPGSMDPRTIYEARNAPPPNRVEDPRKAGMSNISLSSRLTAAGPALRNLDPSMSNSGLSHPVMGGPPGSALMPSEDQEKAALIMQVLQLTEQQIAVLPPEQRQSIMVLKEQLARSQLT